MVNPLAGEVEIRLDGVAHCARLTLGALAEMEALPGSPGLIALISRLEAGEFSGRDLLALLVAGLRGGGWQGGSPDLLTVRIGYGGDEGPLAAARAAADLLTRAFALPEP
ncbi:GTA-gp10 family protein [Pseudogemmobacter faecipullorum]|uniref:Gene transfer agent family protein n=1 Tax=Pseudogemmobacter faecipullorum TaxID=2755041 RepID=A0ABS8CMB8_9RHOB|nr:GTA-gp10 family protein [Pseudogemmobacter faecipullorum]MCB5410015.1 gene transfer agent family protein [Pseudogemmobacter faecipullorum]